MTVLLLAIAETTPQMYHTNSFDLFQMSISTFKSILG